LISPETVAAIRDSRAPKGDPLEAARLAALWRQAHGGTDSACHPLPLTHVDVRAELQDSGSIWKRKSPREPDWSGDGSADSRVSGRPDRLRYVQGPG